MSFQIYELSDNKLIIPMAASKVQTGFPSPAEGYEEERIDLADILITNKASTYCVRVKGNSMIHYKKAGIIVSDIITHEFQTIDLFDNINITNDELLPTLESIKKKYGKNSIKLASELLSDDWKMQRNYTSANYTTDIEQILEVT